MKPVLHVIPSLDKRDGGPSVALPLMARSLAMQGITVDVVTTMAAADAEAKGIVFEQPLPRDGYTVRFFKRQTSFYKVSWPMLRWLMQHSRDYALMHHHALFSFAPLAGAFAAYRHQVPYIMRPLGLLNAWGMQNRRRWVKDFSFRCLDRPALEHAAAIHYTSTEEQAEAARLHLRTRAAVIPLGIDLAPFQQLPEPRLFFERFPSAAGRRVVLFLSRLDPKKGIELLLDAFAALREHRRDTVLVVAGSGEREYEARLRAQAEALHLQEGLELLWPGFLDGEDKRAALAAADLFVLPSRSENFGIALLEAMAAGRACISTDQVALAVDTHDTAALTVVPCDAAKLSHAMAVALDDDALRLAMGHRAAAIALERYSLQAQGISLAKLYRDLLS
ncbi:MAG: glycosyltransferase [Roseimicrobium sp.]